MKILKLALLVVALLAAASEARAQKEPQASPEDLAAVRQTALDYIEGWYEGNAERMDRALHPELAKRIMVANGSQSILDHMGKEKLVAGTRAGFGAQTPKPEQQKDVTVLDVYQNAASVKIVARDWIDYLHMAKWNGKWVIVNVLWEMKPKS